MDKNSEIQADLELVKTELQALEGEEQPPAEKAAKKAAKKAPKGKAKKAPPKPPSSSKRLAKGTKIIDPFTPHSRRIVTVVEDSLNTAGYRRITIQDSYGAIVQRNIAGMKAIEVVE